jgi:hypothetical protein
MKSSEDLQSNRCSRMKKVEVDPVKCVSHVQQAHR